MKSLNFKKYDIPVIEDSAEAWEVSIKIKHVELLEIFQSSALMEIKLLPLQAEGS
jgi:dTDP-4-amino-4,6-dideoxygalactose transaminase